MAQFRIGIAAQFYDHLDDDVAHAVEDALGVLNKLTKGSHEVGLPSLLHAGVAAEIADLPRESARRERRRLRSQHRRAFPGRADAARAVDYIRGWRELDHGAAHSGRRNIRRSRTSMCWWRPWCAIVPR